MKGDGRIPEVTTSTASEAGAGEESVDLDKNLPPLLEDLDIVYCHHRILELKTRELLHSTKWVRPIAGMMPTGESDTAEPQKVVLSEFEVPDYVDFALRRLGDGGEGVLKVGSY